MSAQPIQSGNYFIRNKYYNSLLLDLKDGKADEVIVTFPPHSPPTSNQMWAVTKQGDRYSLQIKVPVSSAYVSPIRQGEKIYGSSSQSTTFYIPYAGGDNEFQISSKPEGGLAMQSDGRNEPVALKNSDSKNDRQLWIFEEF